MLHVNSGGSEEVCFLMCFAVFIATGNKICLVITICQFLSFYIVQGIEIYTFPLIIITS